MARIPKKLAGPQAFAAASAVVYTTPSKTKTVVRHIHVSNPTGSAVSVTVQLDDNAGGDAAAERIFDTYSVAANSVLDHFCYYPIEEAATIRAHASSTSAILTISGDEIILG
jgi:hypothetical protein